MLAERLFRILKFQLLLTVFLTPLLSASHGFGYEHIKVLFFLASTFLAGLNFLILLGLNQIKFSWSKVKLSGILFIGILLLTSITGIDPWRSFMGNQPYFQGFLLYLFLYLFSLMAASVKIDLKWWAAILCFSALVVSVWAVGEFLQLHLLGKQIPTYAGRVVSTFGQPNLYSGFLLLSLPFLYTQIKNQKFRWWVITASVSSILSILVSQSRAATILLTFLIFGWLITRIHQERKSILVVILILVLLILSISAYFATGVVRKELIQPQSNQWLLENSPEKRIYVWQIIGQLILDKTLLGFGLENIQSAYPGYFRKFNTNTLNDPSFHALKNLVVDRSHNYSLDLLMFSGILGFLAWIFLIWQLFRKVKSKILMISLIIYLVWIQLQIQSVAHLMYFWLLVGLVDRESV